MVGDTDRDLMAGRAAGMKTCGVTWGVLGEAGLLPHAPDYLIDRFSELIAIVQGLTNPGMV
jgi:phosphoglycolate phosphatase-like HAD superfamily hydrolase